MSAEIVHIKTEVVEHALAVAPVFFDAHPELEIHFFAEKLFNVAAGGGADAFDHRALLADDDGFLAAALNIDGGVHDELVIFLVALHVLDDNGDAVRHFFFGEAQDLFLTLVHEIEELGHAMGITFDEDLGERNLKILDGLDDDSTTSMQRDVQHGGPSEMDGLVHRIVRLADEYGLELPAYRKISSWAKERGLL